MATVELKRVPDAGNLSGLRPLLRREWGAWWSTRMWLKKLFVWLAVMNGMLLMVSVVSRFDMKPQSPPEIFIQGIMVFFTMGSVAAAIGSIVTTQGAIISERQSGTAAWVLSKPASRRSFILAKFVANGLSLLLLAVVPQGIIAYLQIRLWSGTAPNPLQFGAGVGILATILLFYVALSLMLGTFYRGRGAVAGTAIGFLFGGEILSGVIKPSGLIFPWKLGAIASGVATGGADLPAGSWIPVVVTLLWTVIMVGVALWRFEREEL